MVCWYYFAYHLFQLSCDARVAAYRRAVGGWMDDIRHGFIMIILQARAGTQGLRAWHGIGSPQTWMGTIMGLA